MIDLAATAWARYRYFGCVCVCVSVCLLPRESFLMRYISTTKVAIATKLCQTMAKLIYYIFKLEERRQLKPKAYELRKPFKLNQLFQNFSY